MRCPSCGTKNTATPVIDSRKKKDGEIIWRRRECGNCKQRFTTNERVIEKYLIAKTVGKKA